MVRLLLQHGGKIELGSKPMLSEAIRVQAIDTVRMVIESGFGILGPFKHSLAELDTCEKAKIILLRGSSAEEAKRAEERRQDELRLLLCCPLHYAARARFSNASEHHKAVAIVELFPAHGADPWHSYGNETTIIHDVLHQGRIVEPLLAPSFGPREAGRPWPDTVDGACEISKQDSSIMGLAFDNLELHSTASMQKSQASGFGPPKNQQDETPLHLAWKDRKWDLVRTLLDSRGDPLIPDSKGNTILHLARCLREQQCVTNLYTGSRGQLQDINNRVRKGFSQLLGQGVGINTRNDNSGTPTFANVPSLACIQSLSSPKSGTLSRDFLAQCMRTQQLVSSLNPALREPTLDIKTRKETTIWKDFSRFLDQAVDINTRNDNGQTLYSNMSAA
ncbi:ankyrin repeat-containing protein [Talaromyces pinophilus]|uniref:Ankyrin repeat-containing protein n=1 Tax=Talaromyces pinophilus TaxID=128442 RepID=A0A6V8H9X9_TALPI|nr:ankyrin repeat-containing protein [Talaromyces pinophilus]